VTIAEVLAGVTRVGIDAFVVIDYATANPLSVAVVTELFQRIRDGHLVGVGSTVLLAEVLVRSGGDPVREAPYRDLLAMLRIEPVSLTVSERAAVLRRAYRFSTPDALHLATALMAGCEAFATSDETHFPRAAGEVRILVPQLLTL
jgi:predicted nucleic acid-binding protein